jgi:hypothetical protein
MGCEQLSYNEPDDVPVPAIAPAILLCVPSLVWLALSCLLLSRIIRLNGNSAWVLLVPLILLSVPTCGAAAFSRYRHAPKTWYVVMCLTINGVGFLLSGTPLLLLWAWAMLALLA